MARIRNELDVVRSKMESKSNEMRQVSGGVDPVRARQLDDEFRQIKARRYALTQELNKTKDSQKDASRSLDAARRKAKQDVINEADVICSTLSGAGHDLLSSFNFETVIIDEAAQAVELSALIPLKYQCRRCIMVGGQLDPFLLSFSQTRISCRRRSCPRSPRNSSILNRCSFGSNGNRLATFIFSGTSYISVPCYLSPASRN
jgi:senataxin